MNDDAPRGRLRVITGNVVPVHGRLRSAEEALAKSVGEEIVRAGFSLERHVVVRGDAVHLRELVQLLSNENQADVVILLGGTGFGPHDTVCEGLEPFFERRIEGFAEAYRRMLRSDHGVHSMLARATAGVFNQCVVFALTGRAEDVRMAVQVLIAPTAIAASDLAYGRAAVSRA
jgi:molybdenum cofactor biosynthesis protein B